ncbi:hypothetical protein SK128_004253 [Halocaridina rubra]|uniref:Uncharacterized protein n=1 Tax=Halocaridina rubra TaxID=373956 RepID=A0AAN8XCL3_HALRR
MFKAEERKYENSLCNKDTSAGREEAPGSLQPQPGHSEEKEEDTGEPDERSASLAIEENDTPNMKSEEGQDIHRRLKKGRITSKESAKPIFLSENIRTFNNPISYLGGPTIEYDEGEGGSRSRNDSLTSLTSITSLD